MLGINHIGMAVGQCAADVGDACCLHNGIVLPLLQ
jgi:hypothetical protein